MRKTNIHVQNTRAFSHNLAKLMKQNGISRKELAEICDVKLQTITRWLSDQITPSFYNYIRVAKLFGVSLAYLVGETDIQDNDIADYIVNNRIKALRIESGYTKNRIALKCGLQGAIIEAYEDGVVLRPRLSTYIRIATAFSVSVDYLLGLTDHQTWKEYVEGKDPLAFTRGGEALCIYNGKAKHYALLNESKDAIIYPNGSSVDIQSLDLQSCKIRVLEGEEF